MPKKRKLGFEFWFGSIVGILGGLLGEIWITRWDEWMKNITNPNPEYMISAILTTIAFFLIMGYMFYMFTKELKEDNP